MPKYRLREESLERQSNTNEANEIILYAVQNKEILDKDNPNFNLLLDPKANWALKHLEEFPKEINTCS